MDFDLFNGMKIDELKSYLRLRGLKVSGKKAILVARAFAAHENNAPVVMTAEEVEAELKIEYDGKLKLPDMTLPDPFKLLIGWLDEEEGIAFWPMIPNFYIIQFLMLDSQVEDLNDYKGSKAYSYFSRGWLGKIFYHSLGSSKYCLLKSDCRPSERLNDPPHKLWICITKSDGKVVTAHCTCMAGMSSTCNHIAAALFRVEAAMRLGLINPACTTKPCEWLPNRKEVKPVKVKDLNLGRDEFAKRGKRKKGIQTTQKKEFNPFFVTNLMIERREKILIPKCILFEIAIYFLFRYLCISSY